VITVGLLDLVGLVLTGIVLALPDLSAFPFEDDLDAFASYTGGAVHAFDSILPTVAWATAWVWVFAVYLPVRFGFVTARWVWSVAWA
jgi:hypothetical protein